jgi:hypothetical protein
VSRWLEHRDFGADKIETNPGLIVHITNGTRFPTIDDLAMRNAWWTTTDTCRLECKVMLEVYGGIRSAKGCFMDYTSVVDVAKSSADSSTLPLVLRHVEDHGLLTHLITSTSDRVYAVESMQHEDDIVDDVTHLLGHSYEAPVQKRIIKPQADVHQKRAILSCLHSPLTLIQGHGGTGKTSMVISTAIRAVLNKRGQCMILSPTNKNMSVQKVSFEEHGIQSTRLGEQTGMDVKSRVLLGTVAKATMHGPGSLSQWLGVHSMGDGRQPLSVMYDACDAFKTVMEDHNIPRYDENEIGDYGFDKEHRTWWISTDVLATRSQLHGILCKRKWLRDRGNIGGVAPPYLVVVDEASMVNRGEFRSVLRVCRQAIDEGLRVHLVLMGDACQLHPVSSGQVFVDLVAYGRDVGTCGGWFHELRHNYRLCDGTEALENLLHAIRGSETSSEHLCSIAGGVSCTNVNDMMSALDHISKINTTGVTFMAHTNAECLAIHATIRGVRHPITTAKVWERMLAQGRKAVAVIDGKCTMLNIQQSSPIQSTITAEVVDDDDEGLMPTETILGGVEGRRNMVRVRIEDCMHLYDVGDKILFNFTCHKQCIYKGKEGTITALGSGDGKQAMFTVCDVDGTTHFVSHASKIKPSIAQTVHTAQGSQYDKVVMLAMRATQFMNNRNMFYTAASRAKCEFTLITDDMDAHISQSHVVPMRNSVVYERLVGYNS